MNAEFKELASVLDLHWLCAPSQVIQPLSLLKYTMAVISNGPAYRES